MKSCRPIIHVRENTDLEFQSFINSLGQFLKVDYRPSDSDFTVVQNSDKMSFNNQFVIKFDSNQFENVDGLI